MARTQSLLQLRTRARQFAGMENSEFVSDSELTGYLNQAICDLETQLEAAGAFERRPSSVGFTCSSGVDSVGLPGNVLSVYGVDLIVDSTAQTLERIEFADRNAYRGWAVPTTGTPIHFRCDTNVVYLLPTPNRDYAGTIYYYASHSDLEQDDDFYDGVNGWDNYVVWSVVAQMLAKQEADPSFAIAERGRWLQTILTSAGRLNSSRSPEVQNVYRRRVGRW